MIYLNIHNVEEGVIIAMCDESLIGKTLEEGNVFIDLNTYASFYKGELMANERAKKVISDSKKNMNSANIVGKESVSIAMDSGIIDRGNIGRVQKIPYAHAYTVRAIHP
jgi:hypothetical protein